MIYKVDESCIGCGTCVEACPMEAIELKDGKAVINTEICIQCGTCEGECPISAIKTNA